MRTFHSSSGELWLDQTYAAGTHYVPIPTDEVMALSLAGDGAIVAAVTVWWTDFAVDFAGAFVDPTASVDARLMRQDLAIGALSIAAATDSTGGCRVQFSNCPRRTGYLKIVVTGAGGRLIGAWSSLS